MDVHSEDTIPAASTDISTMVCLGAPSVGRVSSFPIVPSNSPSVSVASVLCVYEYQGSLWTLLEPVSRNIILSSVALST